MVKAGKNRFIQRRQSALRRMKSKITASIWSLLSKASTTVRPSRRKSGHLRVGARLVRATTPGPLMACHTIMTRAARHDHYKPLVAAVRAGTMLIADLAAREEGPVELLESATGV